MTPHRTVRSGRSILCAALVVLLLGACSGDDDTSAVSTTTSTTTTAPGTEATPRASLRDAVEALLAAEAEGDHDTSFRLLGAEARLVYRDVAEWTVRRTQLPATTGFEIEAADDPATVVALVTHSPGLDPFIGLSPKQERQTWAGVEEGGGWLVAGEPEVELLLPPDADATAAAAAWAEAVQACDEAAAAGFEAVDQIFGTSEGARELCDSRGAVAVGAIEALRTGPGATELIAQYSTDALEWARVVPVTAPVAPFFVVLAPIGDEWKVVALYD